jgi:hypothetical protein
MSGGSVTVEGTNVLAQAACRSLCRAGARRVRPCSSRAGTGAKRAASARRAPRYQWHALIKLAGSSWVETASIRRLRVLRGCGSVSNYHSERANLFSTGAALRCERPGKKSRPDPPVHAFDAPSRKGRSRRRWLTGTRDASWAGRNDRALGGLTLQEATAGRRAPALIDLDQRKAR